MNQPAASRLGGPADMRLGRDMLSVAEAEKAVMESVAPLPAEDSPIEQAHGRVLRQVIAADRDLPPFDRVTMDGYALRHAAWARGVRRFCVAGVQPAGAIPLELAQDQDCIEVMTGAMLPGGTDTVVPYEDVARDGGFITIATSARIGPGQAVHRRGSDHAPGDMIVPAGTRLTGREIAVAAACGHAQVCVSMQPAVAVVATGDELVDVGSPVAPHQIRRSNDYALRAALLAVGSRRVERFHLRDMRHEIEHRLWHVIAEYDAVVITGGVSKGRFDYLPAVLAELKVNKIFHGVAQRPGKPMWFGLSARRTPVFALPGNPVSSYTCLHRYVLPALAKMEGETPVESRQVVFGGGKEAFHPLLTCFVPVVLHSDACGAWQARPRPVNTSGDFSALIGTSGFVELPAAPDGRVENAVRFRPWA